MSKYVFAIFLVIVCLTHIKAQDNFTTAGGDAVDSIGSASYSVGQVFHQANESASGSENQGVQQPYEIYEENAIEDVINIELSLSAYPNPVDHFLVLDSKDHDENSLCYMVYDMNGKLLISEEITTNETIISMEEFKPAVYFLKVYSKDRAIKTFKIIKN